jgi:hypothetical protein
MHTSERVGNEYDRVRSSDLECHRELSSDFEANISYENVCLESMLI